MKLVGPYIRTTCLVGSHCWCCLQNCSHFLTLYFLQCFVITAHYPPFVLLSHLFSILAFVYTLLIMSSKFAMCSNSDFAFALYHLHHRLIIQNQTFFINQIVRAILWKQPLIGRLNPMGGLWTLKKLWRRYLCSLFKVTKQTFSPLLHTNTMTSKSVTYYLKVKG